MCIIDAASCQVRKTQGEPAKIQDRAGAVQWVAPGLGQRQEAPTQAFCSDLRVAEMVMTIKHVRFGQRLGRK